MKTRFEQFAMLTMVLILGVLIARNRILPSSQSPKPDESRGNSMSATNLPVESPTGPVSSTEQSLIQTEIRVALTNVPVRSCSLRCDTPIEVVAVDSGVVLRELSRLESRQVTAGNKEFSLGDLRFETNAIELVPTSSPAIWVNGSQFHGRVRLYRTGSERFRIVNIVSFTDYLASVVDSEMPIAFGREARKAQCICSRTYALYQMQQRESHPHFDVFASERSQKYLGAKFPNGRGQLWAGESSDSREAVNQTAGLVCTFHGELFCTYFSATCGGRTTCGTDLFSDSAEPLCGVDCDWCRGAPLYRWSRILSSSDHRKLTEVIRRSRPAFAEIERVSTETSSLLETRPIDRISFSDSLQMVNFTTKALREDVLPNRLLSPMFVAEVSQDRIHITGRGHGHGVGMCQWGARGLGKEGRTFTEILDHYYPGCVVVRWDPIVSGLPNQRQM